MCRVFYSTDSQLPRFIPGFAKDMLTKLASKRSTSWVEKRCNAVTGYTGGGGSQGGRLCRPSRKQATLLLALLLAWGVQGGGAAAGVRASVMDLLAKVKRW